MQTPDPRLKQDYRFYSKMLRVRVHDRNRYKCPSSPIRKPSLCLIRVKPNDMGAKTLAKLNGLSRFFFFRISGDIPQRTCNAAVSSSIVSCSSRVSIRAKSDAVRVVTNSTSYSFWNQLAKPIWSGWWCVTATRITAFPFNGSSIRVIQISRVKAESSPVSTIV